MADTELMYTQEQVNAMLQAEGDRRVTGALKTAQEKFEAQKQIDIENAKLDWAKEMEAQANMSAEEKARKAMADKENELVKRESEIARRMNELSAKETLANANVPPSYYNTFINLLVDTDADKTKANIDGLINTYSQMKNDIETNLKSQLTNVPAPNGMGVTSGSVGKKEFDKMSYSEKVKFKAEHPAEFEKFTH